MREKDDNGPFSYLILTEGIMILLYGLFTRYAETAQIDTPLAGQDDGHVREFYAMYQDVHVMVFVGFGFLMTFLRRYGYGAVGFTFFLSAIAIQWTILVRGFWTRVFHRHFDKIDIDVLGLINADFGAAAVMISFGAVIGKVRVFGGSIVQRGHP